MVLNRPLPFVLLTRNRYFLATGFDVQRLFGAALDRS
jgi:hypothetical protein